MSSTVEFRVCEIWVTLRYLFITVLYSTVQYSRGPRQGDGLACAWWWRFYHRNGACVVHAAVPGSWRLLVAQGEEQSRVKSTTTDLRLSTSASRVAGSPACPDCFLLRTDLRVISVQLGPKLNYAIVELFFRCQESNLLTSQLAFMHHSNFRGIGSACTKRPTKNPNLQLSSG